MDCMILLVVVKFSEVFEDEDCEGIFVFFVSELGVMLIVLEVLV